MKLSSLLDLLPGSIDAAMITSPLNRFYFTDFSSSAGVLLISRRGSVFITDSRYTEAAKNKISCCEVTEGNISKTMGAYIKLFDIRRLAIENDSVTLSLFKSYKSLMPQVEITEENVLDKAINRLRAVKRNEEKACTIKAQRIAERAFKHILGFIQEGKTEREIALEIDFFMLKSGAEKISFETICVSGKNSSMPHGVPSDKAVEKGDFITMDFGAVFEGYKSDMTRTVAVGEISTEQERVYSTVLSAQFSVLDILKAGISASKADAAARDFIGKRGYGEYFRHGTGHGVGLDVHEGPVLSPNSEEILKTGNIVTVEPGIYIPQKFGVRIEDMVFIEEAGHENLTKADKNLIIL